jgi:solute carrier family 35 protein E1
MLRKGHASPMRVYSIRTTLDDKPVVKGDGNAVLTGVYMLVWYIASIIGTIANKQIVIQQAHTKATLKLPILLTLAHLISGLIMDLVILSKRNVSLKVKNDLLLASISVGAMLALGKMTTYFSYGLIPVSLTHTVKSSAPIFSALVALYIFKKPIDAAVYFALVTIAIGVTLSAVTEIEFKMFGFLAAMFATLTGVLHSALLKRVMKRYKEMDTIQLHYHVTISASIIMAICALVFSNEASDASKILNLDSEKPNKETYSASYFLLFSISILAQYVQTIMSTFVLSNVSVISHQVSNTLKRLVLIVSSIWFFKNPVGISNAAGILLALGGFFWYGIAMLRVSKSQSTAETPPVRFRTGNQWCDSLCYKLFPSKTYTLPVFTFDKKDTII